MISAEIPVFPNNVVEIVALGAQLIDDDPNTGIEVFKRPLRPTDPTQCVGVYGSLWTPQDDSIEMKGLPFASPGPEEPTIQRYTLAIQGMVKDAEEDRGLFTHSVLAKLLRSMLYRDADVRVALSTLSVTMDGSSERTSRWGLGQARYLNNEIQGSWIYLSTLEFWLETETS